MNEEMEVKRIGWYNEEAFAQFFNKFYQEVSALYQKIRAEGKIESETKKAWIEFVSERSEFLCLSYKEDNIKYSYLFVVEKFPFGESITKCFRFYKEWDLDYTKLTKSDFVKRFDYYDQYTDDVENKDFKRISKPTISYFKENEVELLQKERFQSENKLFTFKTPNHGMFEVHPQLKEVFYQLTPKDMNFEENDVEVNEEYFFYKTKDIIRVGNLVQNLLGKEQVFSERVKTLEKSIASFVSDELFMSGYEVGRVVRMCKKQKAGSEKTALEGHYAKAWTTKKGKRNTLVIDFCNWNDYTYAFVIHEMVDDYAFFDCYRVFEETDMSKDNDPTWLIKTMDSYVENFSDLENKPTLNMLLSNLDRYKPICSFKKEVGEKSLFRYETQEFNVSFDMERFSFNAKNIERALGLTEYFQED